ncbi:MAG: hypothetical protein Q9163_003943 [Psora crenata]
MAEPFSIVASVVGVVFPALHGTRLLLDDLQKLKDAPETIRCLVEDVHSVEMALTTLQTVEDQEWLSLGIAEESRTTISTCTKACDQFRAKLQHWTRHSEDGKLARKDRASLGFLKARQITAMSEQLQNCKLTISSIVSIATLYSSIRHTRMTEGIKKIISTKQTEIEGAITTRDKKLIVLENKLEELSLSSDEQEAAGSTESKAEALQQLEEERKALNASREVLNKLLSKSQEEAIAKAAAKNQSHSSTVIFGNQNSGFQAGSIYGGISKISFGGK